MALERGEGMDGALGGISRCSSDLLTWSARLNVTLCFFFLTPTCEQKRTAASDGTVLSPFPYHGRRWALWAKRGFVVMTLSMHVVNHEDSHRLSTGTWGSLQFRSGAWRSAMFCGSSGFSAIVSIDWRRLMLHLSRVSFWHDVYHAWPSIGIKAAGVQLDTTWHWNYSFDRN